MLLIVNVRLTRIAKYGAVEYRRVTPQTFLSTKHRLAFHVYAEPHVRLSLI